MPYDDPTDAESGRFAMTAIDRVLTIADAPVPVAYDARDADDVAPRGTYAEPASPSAPAPPTA